jgi:hypothetical protein
MTTYRTEGIETGARFAAGEFSNGAWGFYVPKSHHPQKPTTSG